MQLIAPNAAGMVRDHIPMDPQIRRWVNARTCQLLTARSVVSALPAQIGLRYSVESFLGFGVATWQTMGSVVCLLAFAGLALELAAPLLDRRRPSAPAACTAGLLCLWRSVPQACEPGRCEIFVRTTPLTSAEFQDRLREMQALQQPGGL